MHGSLSELFVSANHNVPLQLFVIVFLFVGTILMLDYMGVRRKDQKLHDKATVLGVIGLTIVLAYSLISSMLGSNFSSWFPIS